MGILVNDLLSSEHSSYLSELCSDSLVRLICVHALEFACFSGLLALGVNAYDDTDIVVLLADLKVLHTVAGSCMNAACTAFESNVVAYDDR